VLTQINGSLVTLS